MNENSKTVVITGASSGFGEGAVKAFADKGYRVWGTMRDVGGRNADKRAALEAYSSKVSVIDMDVANDESVAAGFATILDEGPVDILNEGVDIPEVDRVVMLRPTESPVVFLQQLGRGLRTTASKQALTVIDFVGNHRIFLERVRLLLAMSTTHITLRDYLASRAPLTMPEGCSVDIELEAIDLRRLLQGKRPVTSEIYKVFHDLLASRGVRPSPAELFRLGYDPATLSRSDRGGWFGFLATEDTLSPAEVSALNIGQRWFAELETTAMTKCFKMVVLQVLLDDDALDCGMDLSELAVRTHARLIRSPELFEDIATVTQLVDPRQVDRKTWQAYWLKNPIRAWTREGQSDGATAWFRLEGSRFVPQLPFTAETRQAFIEMTRELVDLRLAHYRARRRAAVDLASAYASALLDHASVIDAYLTSLGQFDAALADQLRPQISAYVARLVPQIPVDRVTHWAIARWRGLAHPI